MSSKKVSRRSFMKNLSGGMIGTGVALHLPAARAQSREKPSPQDHGGRQLLSFRVNGKAVRLMTAPQRTLAEVLRNDLQLTGTKIVCNQGECGGCTVLLNGQAVYSCHMLALDADGMEVTTIEGLMNGEQLGDLQQAFVEKDGLQCGFCTPGQIMSAEALMRKYARPGREEIIEGMSGNLCRCGAYPKIVDSVMLAAQNRRRLIK